MKRERSILRRCCEREEEKTRESGWRERGRVREIESD